MWGWFEMEESFLLFLNSRRLYKSLRRISCLESLRLPAVALTYPLLQPPGASRRTTAGLSLYRAPRPWEDKQSQPEKHDTLHGVSQTYAKTLRGQFIRYSKLKPMQFTATYTAESTSLKHCNTLSLVFLINWQLITRTVEVWKGARLSAQTLLHFSWAA